MVSSRPVDPPNNLGNDRVLVLGFDPVKIGKIPELLVLLYDLCIPDNHFLVHMLTLFNYVKVGRLRLGCTTVLGTIEQFGQFLCLISAWRPSSGHRRLCCWNLSGTPASYCSRLGPLPSGDLAHPGLALSEYRLMDCYPCIR